MTARRAVFAALAALLLAAIVWLLWPGRDDEASAVAAGALPASTPSAAPRTSAAPLAHVSHLADNLNAPAGDIRADLRIVAEVLATFRSNFPHEGNPVGTNAEITAALTGKNKFGVAFIPRGHPASNAAGELCDRWGTPFFFHAESGTRMEIRSAGPDKKLYTADDVVLTP